MYDDFYRITSDIVHFSPRVAMRSGWGPNPRDAKFATKNFARYYLNFAQCYSVYLFALLCKTFRRDLSLDSDFTDQIKQLEQLLDEQLRWPEAVTFEEMNVRGPDNIVRFFMRTFHEQEIGENERCEVINALLRLGKE
jgi:hypothetical protein